MNASDIAELLLLGLEKTITYQAGELRRDGEIDQGAGNASFDLRGDDGELYTVDIRGGGA